MTEEFRDQVVVITGGSRGIGRALVQNFVSKGAKVYFTYLSNDAAAEDTVGLCQGLHEPVANKVDIRESSLIHDFVRLVGTQQGKIDILINNAGVVPRSLLPQTTASMWNNALQTNLSSVHFFCLEAFPFLLRGDGKAIVNISSVAADRPSKGLGAYSATKGALEALTRVMALEYGSFNIRVNTVAPGLILTEVAKDILPEVRDKIISRTPLRRAGTVDDVCEAVSFLASHRASFITGTQLYVTGGKHLD